MQGYSVASKSGYRQQSNCRSPKGQSSLQKSLSSSLTQQSRIAPIPPSPPKSIVSVGGHTLIAPNTSLARAIVMGNQESVVTDHDEVKRSVERNLTSRTPTRGHSSSSTMTSGIPATRSTVNHNQVQLDEGKQISNLTALLNQHDSITRDRPQSIEVPLAEADTASGPAPALHRHEVPLLGRSAPDIDYRSILPPPPPSQLNRQQQMTADKMLSTEKVRRCMSSKELGTLAPPSGSPYAFFLSQKEEIETVTRNRLHELRKAEANAQWHQRPQNTDIHVLPPIDSNEPSSSASSRAQHECANELRNRRRAEHAKAVVDDLCDVVADLFIAESKLLDPRNYGVTSGNSMDTSNTMMSSMKDYDRQQIVPSIRSFVSSLPLRYALGADTPSEVLMHMRLMAAARSNKTKAALHVHNLDDDSNWTRTIASSTYTSNPNNKLSLRLVTISCHDCSGLLEYISRLLASSGSRVLDADVMLSTDGIVLDRFVVEMTGRLRLAKLVSLIETFLRDTLTDNNLKSNKNDGSPSSGGTKNSSANNLQVVPEVGPIYFTAPDSGRSKDSQETNEKEVLIGIPLSEMLSSTSCSDFDGLSFPKLRKMHSMPAAPSRMPSHHIPSVYLPIRNTESKIPFEVYTKSDESPQPVVQRSMREQRPLVNRRGMSDLDRETVESVDDLPVLDYLTVPSTVSRSGINTEARIVPLIPFDELMLIESIGTGRVSTIYRAAWRRTQSDSNAIAGSGAVQMVALKVAMVNASTGDTSHIDELRREADIAARLQHPHICDLVGVAADAECFCLAYEYCEGGSLLSLLSNHTRYYEYLPIALDIAQGMAFLHKKSIIHRDLKPANILLTRDHRAKIADFGMSISNHGQELTAETGTYRYMAPEVIRHESYSSNADVYSFGICLWQLITREIPFATMTPIQAAYAVAEGHRPEIPASTPLRLQEIIRSCWDQDSQRRPSFTYVAMALADYVKMAFSPANVGTLTLQIANEMLATVEGNSTVNLDFSTPVVGAVGARLSQCSFHELDAPPPPPLTNYINLGYAVNDSSGNLGLEIE